jgi:hypothetical protein
MQRYNITITAEATSKVTIPDSSPGVLTANFDTPDGDASLAVSRLNASKIVVIFPTVQALQEYSGSEYEVFADGEVVVFGEVTMKPGSGTPTAPGQTLGTRVFVQHTQPTNPRQNDLWIEVP